jgi:alpha-tubulin suppressor-like RCC1 family protein
LFGETDLPKDLEIVGGHACVLDQGTVRCTGYNERGQLGVGNTSDQISPIRATPATDLGQAFERPAQVSSAHGWTCARSAAGAVKCWGLNAFGQLGLGDTNNRGDANGEMGDALPALRFDTQAPITKIAVGEYHACALSAAAEVFCWGKNASGQLASESTADLSAPAQVHLDGGLVVKDLALGAEHTCLLADTGAVYCFGANDAGQLGVGEAQNRTGSFGSTPGTMGAALAPAKLGTGFVAKTLAAGYRHTCAVADDGRIKCWGDNGAGQLGLGDTKSRGSAPEDVGDALPAVDLGHGQVVTDLACGSRHCCVRTLQNTMKCWGDNADGQLGLGDVAPRGATAESMGDNLPFVPTPPHEVVSSIRLNRERTCARTESGLRCWGRNRAGELGYGDQQARGSTQSTVPRLLAPLGI